VFSVKKNLNNFIYDNDLSHGSQAEDLNRTVQFYLKIAHINMDII